MHQYKVGVQVKTVYEVKELDNDFFEWKCFKVVMYNKT
jgi:restriction endonuclease Mrr